jgi:GNAT superfamily N-acetyltransferase
VTTVTVRLAESKDVPALIARDNQLVGAGYVWADRLGDGHDASTRLALVAVNQQDQSVGHIGIGPVNITKDQIVWDRTTSGLAAEKVPWWKVNSLAVDDEHRHHGVARALMQAVVDWTPSSIIGWYGQVELNRSTSIRWYRRQGFRVTAGAGLTLGERSDGGLYVTCPAKQVIFYGYRANVTKHLAGHGDLRTEARAALAEFRSDVRSRAKGERARDDLGYRLFARRVVQQEKPLGCPHMDLSPRPLYVLGWDPVLRRVCTDCQWQFLTAVEAYDAENHCDGCQRTHPDTILSWAALEEELLIVSSGLCPTCRAGEFEGPLRFSENPVG